MKELLPFMIESLFNYFGSNLAKYHILNPQEVKKYSCGRKPGREKMQGDQEKKEQHSSLIHKQYY